MADPFFPELRKDFSEYPLEKGGGSGVFYRYFENKSTAAPGVPPVLFENLKVTEQQQSGERGSSAFQLYLTFHIESLGGGKYDFSILRAEIDAKIWISPRSAFGTLADFKPVYDDFVASGGKTSPKAAGGVAERYLDNHGAQRTPDGTTRGGHWSTSFDGIRAKTMRHELDHVAFAIKEAEGLVGNFLADARNRGQASAEGWEPKDRIYNLLNVYVGPKGFYLDVGGQEHKQIAMRDFFFMIGWYEAYHLYLPEKSNIGYDAVVAAMTNYRLRDAMRQLNEELPWL